MVFNIIKLFKARDFFIVMEFIADALLVLVVNISMIFGIYHSLISLEEIGGLIEVISSVRLILLSLLIGCLYFIDIAVVYKILFSVVLIACISVVSLAYVRRGYVVYADYIIFILTGAIIALSRNSDTILAVAMILIISNFLFSALMLDSSIKKGFVDEKRKLSLYLRLTSIMLPYLIVCVISSLLTYLMMGVWYSG